MSGLLTVLIGSTSARLRGRAAPSDSDRKTGVSSKGVYGVGFALQGLGVLGYLGIVTFWRRRG